jgi:hypothetical protein
MKRIIFIVFLILLTTHPKATIASDSSRTGQRTVTVIPGPEYKAGWWHRVFFGTQWRALWTTPITVPVLDLESYAGGLTPIKRGGGFQTKSLHFKANNGKFYKFRSINKDPEKLLPKYFRDTFVADIVRDMISTSHPLSALIAAPLLNAVNVLNAQPSVVELPKDQKLGEYQQDFEGVFGTLAENPKDETEPSLIFAGADKIVKEYKIFEELAEDNDDQVDALEYLKARLMDIFLGDWDRHIGQWKWARFKRNGKKIWVPIPRDRDQVFALYNGLIPWITTIAVPQIEGFRDHYSQINDMTWSGRHLDRRFLVSIDKPAWDSVTTFIHTRLTDPIIEDAVHRMPEEWYAKEGEQLIQTLKKRRNHLHEISEEYYEMISRYVSIYTSDKIEFAEIDRLDNDRVRVNIYKKDKKTGDKKGEPIFHRVFHADYTKEIRIDLLGGDDTAIITGEVDRSITIRIIGGKGKDKIIDHSIVHGYFLSFTPFPDADTKSFIYDSGNKTEVVLGPSSKLITVKTPILKTYDPETDNHHPNYESQIEDRDYDWKRGFWLNFNSNDGLTIGGGPILYKFAFRVEPYDYRMSLLLAYITNIQTFVLDYKGESHTLIKNIKTTFDITKITGRTYFYDFGNETQRNEDLENQNFYQVRPDLFEFKVAFHFGLSEKSSIWVGSSFNNSMIKYDPSTLLDSLQLKTAEERSQRGIHVGYTLDTRDHGSAPMNGIYLDFKSLNYPKLLNKNDHYSKVIFDARAYLEYNFITQSSLAMRVTGEKVWGNYPLHMTPFLGGTNNLHGFERNRFAGNALVYAGSELRSYLFPLKILVPSKIGFSAFAETGRVFYPGENSKKWHPSFGGGFWLVFLNRELTLNLSLAQSSEGMILYLTTGFLF